MSRIQSVGLLCLVVILGWAAPASAQPLQLNVSTFNGAIGVNNFTLQATGGLPPYHYSIAPGFTPPPGFRVQDGPPLPTNFTVLPTGTGGFLGVATTSGTFTTTIRVTDAATTVVDRAVTLNIPPLQMSTNPPKATLGVPYSFTMKGFGGGGTYTWSATNMPAGLSIDSGTGTISGTPTVAGVFNNPSPTITMTDGSLMPPLNTLARGTAMTVDPFAITTSGPIIATAGVFYTQTLQAPGCGSPCTWSSASLGGLSLNSGGVLSGTGFSQTGTITATATGPNGSVSKLLAVFVSSPSTALSSGFGTFSDQTVGNFLTNQVLPFGGTPPYTVSLVSGTLPPGISLQPGAGLCTTNCAQGMTYLAGRAMQVGVFTFTLQFQDSAANTFTPAPYNWRISPLNNQYNTLPLANTLLTTGAPYTQPLLVIGGSNSYTWTNLNALVPGLGLDPLTGVVSGTPTQSGGLNTSVRVTDSGGATFTGNITMNVSGPPTVVTLPATFVTNTSARLNGTYNPGGFSTNATFDWGPTTAYGNTAGNFSASNFNTQNVGTNINITCVAGSVYHYRLRATNSQGTGLGADQTFTCSPQVFTFNAFNIGAFSATLNGAVNPNGLATTADYQWGLTASYGSSTPIQSVGSGTQQVNIDGGEITGLSCNTVYHFRARAANANGTSFGNDITFTTNPCTPGVFTGVAAVVGQTGATMLGAVVPNGQLTNAHFEWGATTAYGNITPDQAMGSGLEPLLMGAVPITGLVCNTTYHFRTVAQNSFGPANGVDRAFTTAPCAATPIKGTVYALNGRYPFTNLIYGYGVTNAGALIQLPGFPLLNGVTGDDDTSAPEQVTYDPAQKRLYVINGTLGTLSVFNVDTRTGALTQAPFSPIALDGGVLWTTVHVHPSGSPVVVGGIVGGFDNPAATGQVASYVITPTTATPAAGSPFAASVAYVFSSAFSRDGNYLYAGAGDGDGTHPSTAGYAVNPSNGVLAPLGGSPFTLGGSFPIAYATDTGGRLFSATNEDNQIRAFTTSGGIPTGVSGNPFAAPGLNDALSGVVHPAGFYMVVGEGSGISVYQIAGSGAATSLTNVAGSPFATGGESPTSLVLSKDGNLLIVSNGDSRNLRVFSVNASTGALTPLSTQPFDTLADNGAVPSITFAPSDTASFGDFDGDGKGDLLLRNKSTGQNIGWLMNGLTVSTSAFMPTIADTNWKIVGRGDFDGDGKTDVILRNSSTGQDIGWLMNGLTVSTSAFMPTIADTNWEIRGVGDFDGNGKADVILRNKSTGQNIGWLMNGLTVSTSAFMPTIADTNWEIVAVGDFDGDGKADVLLRNRSTGQNIGWLMNGLTVATSAFLPTIADTNWEIKGARDLSGDGKADVVLRNKSTGQNIGWLMNGLTVSTSAFMPTIADTNWEIKGAGDFNGDGKADIILRNKSTGQDIGWLMNGLTVSTSAFMPTIADTNWEFVGQGQ